MATKYHVWPTYGRPLILRSIDGTVTGYANAGTNRRIDEIKPDELDYHEPGLNQDYYNALITEQTCHGPAYRVIGA